MMIPAAVAMYAFIGGVSIGAILWQVFQTFFLSEIKKDMCEDCKKMLGSPFE